MRIAMIGPVLHSWGGSARSGGVSTYTCGLSTALAELGVELSLLGDNTDASEIISEPIQPSSISYYRMNRIKSLRLQMFSRAPGVKRLVRAVVRLGTTTNPKIPWRQRLRYLDRAANYEHFLQDTGPRILHLAHAEFRQFLCQQIARTEVPVVASVLSATVFIRPTPEWLREMTILNYNRASRLLPCSNFVREMIAPFVEQTEKMIVIPNGTDVDTFHPAQTEIARRELRVDPNEFIILYTGSLVQPKGVSQLLEAFIKEFDDDSHVRLVYVGSGPESEHLERMAAHSGAAGRVTLAGYQADELMPHWYTACDIFSLPSQSEGLSGSLLEAMACGKPVITTMPNLGEHDAVEPGINGILVPYGDVDALANALGMMYRSPDMVRQMGTASRKKAERQFSWQEIARSVRDVYQDILID